MMTLLLILTPISLLDSLSVVPLCIVPLAILLGGKRPILGPVMLIAGIFVTYFPFGLLLIFGLDHVLDRINEIIAELWKEPDTLDLILQIIIGLAMLIFGYRAANARESHGERDAQEGMTPTQAFMLGAMLNLTGMWGALPYFAAIDQILRADIGSTGMILAVIFYNVIFTLPLLAFIVLRIALGEQANRLFQKLTQFLSQWGRRLIIAILLILGLVLIIDAIGWFAGMPLIPV
jgi:cytochrome c biogenesis protein CcdA